MIPIKVIKSHINLHHDSDDNLLEVYLNAAIQAAEDYTNLSINRRRFTQYLDGFTDKITLGFPLDTVHSVTYYDVAGDTQTLNPAVYDIVTGLEGYMQLAFNQSWPALQENRHRLVAIEYTAGYPYDTLPDSLKLAILVMTGNFYENREPVSPVQLYKVPLSFQFLLNPFRRVNI